MWGSIIQGGMSIIGGLLSSGESNDAQNSADQAQAASLAFDKQQYNDWKAIYGPLEQNLATYYNNLSPEYYEAIGLEALDTEFSNARESLSRSLAQRGMGNSGLATASELDTDIAEAEAKAGVRRGAEEAVMQQKAQFLGLGMGSNPAGTLSANYANQATQQAKLAGRANKASGQAWGNAVNVVGQGITDSFFGDDK